MIGKTISHYNITDKLGEGGMGIVYRAHDTKLERDVALKFLPAHLSASEADKARFIQEAKAAGTLDHANICTIYSIEEHDSQLFIVMQLVEGQLLRDRMSGMTQKQAIETGIQVAEGLAAAHEKGVVHRDIKPENIMIRKDGVAQIMDFGLAKLKGVSRLTKEGSTVGTAGYMSPEQVQGQDADHRSDIFSLGVLLYEMITGQLPFKGVHETAIAYEIVNVDAPPMAAVKPEIDPGLDAIILECLEKDPNERTQAAKQVAIDLKRYRRESSRQRASRITAARPVYRESATRRPEAGPVPAISRSRELIAWGIAGILLVGLGILFFTRPSGSDGSESLIRSSIVLPESLYVHSYGAGMGPPVLSPDGGAIAFTGIMPDGVPRIFVRPVDGTEARPLPGTEFGTAPFWAPDGKRLGFFQGAAMKKIDLVGGSPATITRVPNNRGGTWNQDDIIVYSPDYQSGLFIVNADGKSEPVPLTVRDSTLNEGSHRWPHFLPDGRHVLFLSRAVSRSGTAEGDAVYIVSLDGSVRERLVQSTFNPSYASGYLLFARQSALLAQRFDPGTLRLEGDPVIIQEGLLTDISYNEAVYSVSDNGLLLYQTGTAIAGARPIFLDRSGKTVRTIDDPNEQSQPRFSRDGRQLALYLYDTRSRQSNIWIYDLRTGGRRRLTTRTTGDFFPVWSHDGNRVFFSSGPANRRAIYVQSTGHSGAGQLFYDVDGDGRPTSISPDGSLMLVELRGQAATRGDLFLLKVDAPEADPVPVAATPFDEQAGEFSPDGRWVVYTSDESGQDEVYLLKVDHLESDPWKISSDGAFEPRWGPDGNELFYINYDRMLMAKSLRFSGERGDVISSKPLFRVPAFADDYDITPDGKTFVITRSLEVQDFGPMSLVVNWQQLLETN